MKPNKISANTFAMMTAMMMCLESVAFAYEAQTLDPTEQLRPFVENMLSVFRHPDSQHSEKREEMRDKAMQAVSERFDLREMSKRVLGRTWNKLDAGEQDNFVVLFTRLLEHAYLVKIEGYSKQEVVFKDQRIKGERAQVNTAIVDTDTVVSVSYIMLFKGDKWMVYDVVVEGVSLVRNYLEQFQGIVRKKGYASLVKQVETKIAELEQNSG